MPETQVTRAMLNGEFNPHLADVVAAYEELPGLSCGELIDVRMSWFSQTNTTEQERQTQRNFLTRNIAAQCPGMMRGLDDRRIDAWNARFGILDTADMPPDIARFADSSGATPRTTVVAFFMRNQKREEAYAQSRCNFTSALSEQLPSMTVHVDCPNGMRPSVQTDRGLAQLAAARRDDVFGPANGVFALRLRLMHDGAFEGLQTLIREDVRVAAESAIPFRAFAGARDLVAQQSIDSGYVGLIALYTMLRLDSIGACGDTLSTLTQRTEFWTEYRTLSGQYRGESAKETMTRDFQVLAKFAPTIMQARVTDRIELGVFREIGGLFDAIGCNDPRRTQLEANMIAYLGGAATGGPASSIVEADLSPGSE